MDMEKIINSLKKNRYDVTYFETKEEARDYLNGLFDQQIIGFGDSVTMDQLDLYNVLSSHNTVYDPKQTVDNDDFLKVAAQCLTTDYYLTSVNGMTEDGVIINMDGTGNRVAASLFGHKKVYYIIGRNKIDTDIESTVKRVRNIAAPKNAQRLKLRTPCAIKGDRCYNCASPDRICNALLIELKKMNDIEMEVVLINEDLGY